MKTNENFVLRELYGKTILMPIRRNDSSNDPIFLNSVGAVIWKKAPMANSRKDLLEMISIIYGLSKDSAEEMSVDSFIGQLLDMRLLIEA